MSLARGRSKRSSEVEEELNPIVDFTDFYIKPDHFDGIHVLDDALEKIEGAPNFRNIPGFPVYGTAQPTLKGMEEIVKKIIKRFGKDSKIHIEEVIEEVEDRDAGLDLLAAGAATFRRGCPCRCFRRVAVFLRTRPWRHLGVVIGVPCRTLLR